MSRLDNGPEGEKSCPIWSVGLEQEPEPEPEPEPELELGGRQPDQQREQDHEQRERDPGQEDEESVPTGDHCRLQGNHRNHWRDRPLALDQELELSHRGKRLSSICRLRQPRNGLHDPQ